MSEIKNGRLGLYGKVQQFEELGFKGLIVTFTTMFLRSLVTVEGLARLMQ